MAELDATERGFVLGALLAATGKAEPELSDHLAAPARQRCGVVIAALMTGARTERLRVMSLLAREALASSPAGLEHVHQDVLCDLLASESDPVTRLFANHQAPVVRRAARLRLESEAAGPGSAGDVTDDWPLSALSADLAAELSRAVLVPVVAVPPLSPGEPPPRRWGRQLSTLAPDALMAELMAAGAELLGTSLQGGGEDALRRAVAHVGAPWAERIQEAAHRQPGARTDDPDHSPLASGPAPGQPTADDPAARRARARALVAGTPPADGPLRTLERLGARALGDRLRYEDPDLVLSVAQRLPRALGTTLLEVTLPEVGADSPSVRPTSGSG